MKLDLFDFHLPEELIAQVPLENREASRLMVLDKETGEVKHDVFKHITEYLEPGDCLVLNDTKVLPARLYGVKRIQVQTLKFCCLNKRKMMYGKHL